MDVLEAKAKAIAGAGAGAFPWPVVLQILQAIITALAANCHMAPADAKTFIDDDAPGSSLFILRTIREELDDPTEFRKHGRDLAKRIKAEAKASTADEFTKMFAGAA